MISFDRGWQTTSSMANQNGLLLATANTTGSLCSTERKSMARPTRLLSHTIICQRRLVEVRKRATISWCTLLYVFLLFEPDNAHVLGQNNVFSDVDGHALETPVGSNVFAEVNVRTVSFDQATEAD